MFWESSGDSPYLAFPFPKETNIITCSVNFKKRRKHSVESHLQLRIPAACQALPDRSLYKLVTFGMLGIF